MELSGRVYDLAFLFPRKQEGRRYPELVLRLRSAYQEELLTHLETGPYVRRLGAAEYLAGYDSERTEACWRAPLQSVLGFVDQPFGYGQSCYVREQDGEVEYHFPFIRTMVGEVALTLHAVLMMCTLLQGELDANRVQLAEMRTCCKHSDVGYGHATTGDLHPDFRRWLRHLGERPDKDELLRAVRRAMCTSWTYLSHPLALPFAKECRARVHDSGRFLLECPGNACDLAIYPDQDYAEHGFPTKVGCHNLDAAHQQLTLLAGFAVLCELAREELG